MPVRARLAASLETLPWRSVLAAGVLLGLLGPTAALAADAPAATTARQPSCAACAEWNRPHAPFRLFGNAWFVGTQGLSAVLVTSDDGHVLLDGGLPESAPLIAANIAAAGFDIADVRFIVNSHAHYDHAGGLAELQRSSGARVVASANGAAAIRRGEPGRDDPQHAEGGRFPAVADARAIADGDVLRVGPLAITAHYTPGHTVGSTTWTWRSCEGRRCLDMVYADSLTAVSSEGFRFSDSREFPEAAARFARSIELVAALPCDLLVTPHPDASGLWQRFAGYESGDVDALVDRHACRKYADSARTRLEARLANELATASTEPADQH